ncbi:caspase family protein [Amycolatopsis sp. NPDC051061]|uniref:caspase family protein n=1 Tax=Amycolatopsis sp. NPDC051061 TaxID=3155042 RepID=UPI00343408CC
MDSARSALIVASASYTDPGLRQLRAPGSDAEALAAVLRDPAIGGFEVRTLLDEPAHHITLAVEEFFADRHPDDLLLVHFSCHGLKDEEGELYFATKDTRLRRLGATAVAAEFVNRRMGRSRCRRIVLLLDCCYAGAFERGMTARAGGGVAIEAQFGGRGRAVITASSAMEYAFEGDELTDAQQTQPSVFTGALVTGLSTGEADRDQDGMVALDELYDYVYDAVRATTPNQTPGKWVFGVHGELYIARRARPVTTPAPLPAELHDAADSPFASIREAAVRELTRLLHGRHAGLALAARQTLERLTDDDSRTVATAAAAAISIPPTGHAAPTPLAVPDPQPDIRRLSATSDTAAQFDASTGTEPAVPVNESDPHPRPETTTKPRQPTTASDTGPQAMMWAERGLLTAGCLEIVGAVLSLLSMFPYYVGSFHTVDEARFTWNTVIGAAAAVIAGVLLLAPGTRRLAGPGFLLGSGALALNAIIVGITLNASLHYGVPGAGMWLDVTSGAVRVLAIVIVVVCMVGSGSLRLTRRPAPYSWLAALAGVVGAVALYVEQRGMEWFVPEVDTVTVTWTSVVAVVIPMLAAMILPHRFAIALLAGWLAAGLGILAFNSMTGVTVFTATLGALAIALALLIHAERRSRRSDSAKRG